jgi:hypothetical protein
MRKRITLAVRIELVKYTGQTVLDIHVCKAALPDWCLGLCLLKEGLVDSLVVAENLGEKEIEIEVVRNSRERIKPEVDARPKGFHVLANIADVDYWLHFFLKYYRDGVAEAKHLDLEVVSLPDKEDGMYVTLEVDDAAPPVDAEETRRRLGLS